MVLAIARQSSCPCRWALAMAAQPETMEAGARRGSVIWDGSRPGFQVEASFWRRAKWGEKPRRATAGSRRGVLGGTFW